jgi:hypothetical protein
MIEVPDVVQRQLERASPHHRRLRMAGATIELQFPSEMREHVLPPFAHLVQGPGEEKLGPPVPVDLTIAVAALRDDEVDVRDVPDTGVVHSEEGRFVHVHRESVIAFDRDARRVDALLRVGGGVASWHRAKPLQVALSTFFADRGVDFLHAGLVSSAGNGVLLTGASGSGKSTLSVASLLTGLDYLGDDCVAAAGTRGFSIYASGCIESEHLRMFPLRQDVAEGIGTRQDAEGEGKVVLPLSTWFAGQLARETRIRAIVLPRVTRAASISLRPATGRDALLALAPGTILKRAVPAAIAMQRMTRLVSAVPVFHLEMGPIVDAGLRIQELLTDLGEGV